MSRYHRPDSIAIINISRFLLLVTVGFLVFFALSDGHSKKLFQYDDKFRHFFAFSTLTAMVGLSFPKLKLLKGVVLIWLCAGGIELAQLYMNFRRTASWSDQAVNMTSVALVALTWVLYCHSKKKS